MLPGSIINYPKYKCLNIHASLLPDLRGAVPIPMAILRGYEKTGVSIPVMTEGLDDGPIVTSAEIKLKDFWTTADLTHWLSEMGARKLVEILLDWTRGKIKPVEQDEGKATYCYMKDISKERAEITFDKSAVEIDRMIRAFYPWPVAWFKREVNGLVKRVKIYRSKMVEGDFGSDKKTGQIFKYGKRLFLRCRDGVVEILSIQVEGKKIGSGEDYSYLV